MHELWETELRENFVRVYGRDKETEKREGGLSPISIVHWGQWFLFPGVDASTSFVFVALLNKQQIVNCDRTNNYRRPELFVSDFSTRTARFGRQRRRESFVC